MELFQRYHIRNPLIREMLAEFLGTFLLVLFGDASVAQSKLTNNANGDFFSINWGWGLGVMMGILVAGNISGAHLNPAVSLALAIFNKFSWMKLLPYIFAQYLGALAAAACVLGVYSEAIWDFSNGNLTVDGSTGTAGIFSTYPAEYVSAAGGFGDQVMGTMLLLLCICAIVDKKNANIPSSLVPLYIGFVILAIGVCFGSNCGYAINPARDLAPRFLTYIGGWGTDVFSYRNYNWFWVPIIGPHIGAILGVLIYSVCIELHWPETFELGGVSAVDDKRTRVVELDRL